MQYYATCRSLRRPWPAPRTTTACERDKSLTVIHVVHMSIPFLLLPLPLLLPMRGLKWREAWVRQRCGNTKAQRPTIIRRQQCLSMYYCNSEGPRSRNGTHGISLNPPPAFPGLFITSSTLLESVTALMIHSTWEKICVLSMPTWPSAQVQYQLDGVQLHHARTAVGTGSGLTADGAWQ